MYVHWNDVGWSFAGCPPAQNTNGLHEIGDNQGSTSPVFEARGGERMSRTVIEAWLEIADEFGIKLTPEIKAKVQEANSTE